MNLDQVTLENFPLLAAPHVGAIQEATKPGVRYLVAKNGLWRAIDKSWLKALTAVALTEKSAIPYGSVAQTVDFLCSMPPACLWREFAVLAKAALPNEVAGAMVWNSRQNSWRMAARESIAARDDYVKYREVDIGDDEELVVDIHSHGHDSAYFSSTDNADDHGSIKVAAVLGCVGTGTTQIVARLMLIDKAIDLEITSSGGWNIQEVESEASHSQ